jgi:hypothetical protein
MTTIHKPLLDRNRAPALGMKSWPLTSFSLESKRTTLNRDVWFDKVVTKATRLIRPHKTRHAVNT